MNFIASFFTGIAAFFSGLFGHQVAHAPIVSPISNVDQAVVVSSSSTIVATSSEVIKVDTSTWKTYPYKNSQGLTLKYPNDWTIVKDQDQQILFLEKGDSSKAEYIELGIQFGTYADKSVKNYRTIDPKLATFIGTIDNQKVYRTKSLKRNANGGYMFSVFVYDVINKESEDAHADAHVSNFKHGNNYYDIAYYLPRIVDENNYNPQIIGEADQILSTLTFDSATNSVKTEMKSSSLIQECNDKVLCPAKPDSQYGLFLLSNDERSEYENNKKTLWYQKDGVVESGKYKGWSRVIGHKLEQDILGSKPVYFITQDGVTYLVDDTLGFYTEPYYNTNDALVYYNKNKVVGTTTVHVSPSEAFGVSFLTGWTQQEGEKWKATKPESKSVVEDFSTDNTGFFSVKPLINYENQSRIYFTPPSEKDGCSRLAYLDKKSLLYYSTSLSSCPQVPIEKTKPYYIENPDFANVLDASALYVDNLDTGTRYEIYKPSENESLFAGFYGDYGQASANIEFVDNDKIKISIYKRIKSMSELKNMDDSDLVSSKIRDEIVPFRVK